ncbi:MAG: LacI family DNA-binding transcriptional regulator [Eubacterium sp.]|nr:LacI family DNA-binding transcriptional regulator [Eubacterium sp.]
MWNENKVRISDIAEELGVSTATVSNVLHGKTQKISDATVKKVEKKLEERGYIPNMAATLLARNNSRIIGVIVNDHVKYEGHTLEDPFVSASLNHLADEIAKKNYFFMIKKVNNINEIISFSSMWNMDGMIVIGFCEEDFQNLRDHIRIPFVLYDGYMTGQERISNVKIDDVDGGRQVGRYLKKQGHNKVLCISDNYIYMDLDRYNGLCEGLKREVDRMVIPMKIDERIDFYEKNLKKIMKYTAIFAVSDYYALDLMAFLSRKGIYVPKDISVVGFDGSLSALRSIPKLTTVDQNNPLRAKMAMDLLAKMIKNPGYFEEKVVPVNLLEGDSVICLE